MHLFIICAVNGEDAFLATISKWTNDLCDATCILEAGVHPFIVTKSYVLYRKCRIESCTTLINGVEKAILVPRDPLAEEPFAILCDGITTSLHTLAHEADVQKMAVKSLPCIY